MWRDVGGGGNGGGAGCVVIKMYDGGIDYSTCTGVVNPVCIVPSLYFFPFVGCMSTRQSPCGRNLSMQTSYQPPYRTSRKTMHMYIMC